MPIAPTPTTSPFSLHCHRFTATDDIWPVGSLAIYVTDLGSGTVFGPYTSMTNIKYTEDSDAVPESKKIGSANGADAVAWHIIGNGDAEVTSVDGSGNVSEPVYCFIPPPPMAADANVNDGALFLPSVLSH